MQFPNRKLLGFGGKGRELVGFLETRRFFVAEYVTMKVGNIVTKPATKSRVNLQAI
jgi:hypothetical protein